MENTEELIKAKILSLLPEFTLDNFSWVDIDVLSAHIPSKSISITIFLFEEPKITLSMDRNIIYRGHAAAIEMRDHYYKLVDTKNQNLLDKFLNS